MAVRQAWNRAFDRAVGTHPGPAAAAAPTTPIAPAKASMNSAPNPMPWTRVTTSR
jgi:hypothetical protein